MSREALERYVNGWNNGVLTGSELDAIVPELTNDELVELQGLIKRGLDGGS